MVQDIITVYEKMDLERPLPNFTMPWWYEPKTFGNDKERLNGLITSEVNKDNQVKLEEFELKMSDTYEKMQSLMQMVLKQLEMQQNLIKDFCTENNNEGSEAERCPNTQDQSKPEEHQTNKTKQKRLKEGLNHHQHAQNAL